MCIVVACSQIVALALLLLPPRIVEAQTVFACDFNTPTSGSSLVIGWCNMTHDHLWFTRLGPTSTYSTGPSMGQGGLSDRYAYIESSYCCYETVSTLTTPPISLGGSPGVVSFYYFM